MILVVGQAPSLNHQRPGGRGGSRWIGRGLAPLQGEVLTGPEDQTNLAPDWLTPLTRMFLIRSAGLAWPGPSGTPGPDPLIHPPD